MRVFKIKDKQVIAVECEKMAWPELDSDGDMIYENTHFSTQAEAYNKLIESTEAFISLITKDLIAVREKEQLLMRELASECIFLENLKSEFQASNR